MTMKLTLWSMAALVAVGAFLLRPKGHSEEALLTDWSDPPPFPIFIVLNVLAGTFRALADALTPPPIRMLEIGFAYQSSMLAQICQSSQIPDFVATGPKTVPEIANHLQTSNLLVVERILFAMASHGMLKLDVSATKEEPRFVNTALSATLRSDHPNSVRGMIGHLVEDGFEAFGKLPQLLEPNPKAENGWDLVYPDYPYAKGGLWSFYQDKPAREEQFGRAMWSLEGLGGKAMALDGPFDKFSRVIDVGGSLGHFLYKIMDLNKNATGILFDRPQVLENAKELWYEDGGTYKDGTHERVTMVTGDFLSAESIPVAQDGDAYLMRYILHDWSTEECLKILRNLRQQMGSAKATLVIGECAMPDRDTVGVPSAMYSIDMLMLGMFGGALERTPSMWKELLGEAGFELVDIHPTRSLIHFVEAVPVP